MVVPAETITLFELGAPMTDTANCIAEVLLASTADLAGVAAHLVGARSVHSSRHRRDRQLLDAALSHLEWSVRTIVQPAPAAPAVSVQQRAAARKAAGLQRRRVVAEAVGVSGPLRRRHCECGQCGWCRDNLRWDRIYNEKFADPAYYGHLVLRQNSTLSTPR